MKRNYKALLEHSLLKISKEVDKAIKNNNYINEDSLTSTDNESYQYQVEIKEFEGKTKLVNVLGFPVKNGNIMLKSVSELKQLFDMLDSEDGVKYPSKNVVTKDKNINLYLPITVVRIAKDTMLDDSVKINRKGKSNINEDANFEQNTEDSGVFITDFTYFADEDSRELTDMDAARLHVKYLINKGLDIEFVKKRYSINFVITYKTHDEYEELLKWLGWHIGENDFIQTISKKLRPYLQDLVLNKGKKTQW